MKKYSILLLLVFLFTMATAQKREKIKGSRIVTVEQKEIGIFENLEVEDNIGVILIKGDKSSIEIDADDNLHAVINISLNGNTLRLTTSKEVSGFKKFNVKVTYTNDFKMLIAKHEATVSTLTAVDLESFTLKVFDYSKIFTEIKTKSFTLMANDKTRMELNIVSEKAVIELSKNAQLKALITANQLKFDMYQKSLAEIEGDVSDLKLRLGNNAEFMCKNLNSKTADLTMEESAKCLVVVSEKVSIDASGKSEIQLFGNAKIEMKNFIDSAVLFKKQTK